ncbi:hypothetical protein V1478_012337 [Vespula squamosa]|uniref:Uncharacterized protein n=1 Tax=Vespula squamosa TaxID=30214 RepID=A0ABD2ADH8_VESSQ
MSILCIYYLLKINLLKLGKSIMHTYESIFNLVFIEVIRSRLLPELSSSAALLPRTNIHNEKRKKYEYKKTPYMNRR